MKDPRPSAELVENGSPRASRAFVRDLRDEDLIECLSVSPGRMGDELTERAETIQVWRSLTREPAWTSTVAETTDGSGLRRIVGFGSDALISREFVDAELANPRPGLNSRILYDFRRKLPAVLNPAQIREGNTRGGLDIAILYASVRFDLLSKMEVSGICALMSGRFFEARRGYRVNRLITEAIGDEERETLLAIRAWQETGRFKDDCGRTRSFMVMTRETTLDVAASLANQLFLYHEPKLRLRDADQKLLLCALDGLTDEELTRKLRLSLPGITKRWLSIFERTIHAHPELFPDAQFQANGLARSGQKRHHVLAYVRAHPEELRASQNDH